MLKHPSSELSRETDNPRATAAIVGSGNIGTDLMYKLQRSSSIDLQWMVGIDPESDGLRRAEAAGVGTSAGGVDWLLALPDLPDIVFEATSSSIHQVNAPRYAAAGIRAVDLTPAAIGPFVVPAVNLEEHGEANNLNMVTCGGQATIPMVHAVSRLVDVEYAEIVATVASRSAGPGTRQNIDEFTRTTARAVETVGGARHGKAIIILNPADPPLIMRDTIFCSIPPDADTNAIGLSIAAAVQDVQRYVPGYRLVAEPQFERPSGHDPLARVSIFVEVAGAGDYLPIYAGNLDIMTAAATRAGEGIARLSTRSGVS